MRRFPRFDFRLELCKSLWIFYLKRNYVPYFWVPLNHSWLFSLTLTEIQFGYIGKVILDIPLFLDFLLFYKALLLIFLDFLNELLQNYLFLEEFQMLIYCHCPKNYQMFYHSTFILRDSMQTEIHKKKFLFLINN